MVPLFDSPFAPDVAFATAWGDTPLLPLHPAEAAIVAPGAADSYKRDFRMGRHAARVALAQLGVSSDPPILRGPHREPLWPEYLVGSITHAAGIALAAVAKADRYGGIGLDLESMAPGRFRPTEFDGIMDLVATDPERRWINAHTAEQRPRLLLQLFSAKESVFKAFFPRIGTYFDFQAACLSWEPAERQFRGRLTEPYGDVAGADAFHVRCRWTGPLLLTSLLLPPIIAAGPSGGAQSMQHHLASGL